MAAKPPGSRVRATDLLQYSGAFGGVIVVSSARIGDTCLVGDGTHSKIPRQETGVLYLTCRNFKDGRVDLSNVYYISEDDYAKHFLGAGKALARPETGDLVFSIIGTIGEPYLIRPSDRFGISSSVAIVRPNPLSLDPRFLLYWFKGPAFQNALRGIKGGVAQGYVSLEMIRSLPVSIMPLPLQRHIVGILSAYDDLIDNNTRRIAVLEEMARRIFEEWFIHFRAPGCEGLPLIDSPIGPIPQGWELLALGESLAALESGSRPKGGIKEIGEGVPSIGAENIDGLGHYDYNKERLIPRNFFDAMRRGKVRSGDVMLYKDGAHIGRKALFRDDYPYTECAINEHVFALRTKPPFTSAFVYFWLDTPELTNRIMKLNSNAAQPGINQVGVSGLPLLKPSNQLIERFSTLSEPLLALLFNLAKANRNLRAQRNLLLPKLISGEIDVSATSTQLQAAAE